MGKGVERDTVLFKYKLANDHDIGDASVSSFAMFNCITKIKRKSTLSLLSGFGVCLHIRVGLQCNMHKSGTYHCTVQ